MVNTGDTAFILVSAALVMFMTPGLALYGGMVRNKNVLATIMQSYIIICLVSVSWTLWGYSLSFGPDVGGVIGNLSWFALRDVGLTPSAEYATTVPHLAFMVFQLMFAIITPLFGRMLLPSHPSGIVRERTQIFRHYEETGNVKMDRNTWLKEMRRDCEEQYDTRWAPLYGEKWGLYSNTTHQQLIQEFLSLLPHNSMTLDAACGAGRYLPYLLEKGHSIIAIDQSQGMLARAKAKFPGVQFEKVGLQEMAYREVFDGAICMDAMENVCPEDWPLVLSNFHRALKGHGYLYFTAETIENADEEEIKQAFERAGEAGLPVVYGEWPDEEVYHYHPTNQQVTALAIAAIASFFAGTVSTLVLAAAGPWLGRLAITFGPAEYFSLMTLGLAGAVVLAHGSLLKSVAMTVLGLVLGLVGTDLNSGAQRYTFGVPELGDGIGFVVIAMGVFGFAEIVTNLTATTTREVRKNVQVIVQQMWKAVGVDTELINHQSDLFFASYADKGPIALGQYDIALEELCRRR